MKNVNYQLLTIEELSSNNIVVNDASDNSSAFFSYGTLIALKDWKGNILIDSYYYCYFVTTSKYLYKYLGITGKKELLAKVADGEFTFTDLQK